MPWNTWSTKTLPDIRQGPSATTARTARLASTAHSTAVDPELAWIISHNPASGELPRRPVIRIPATIAPTIVTTGSTR